MGESFEGAPTQCLYNEKKECPVEMGCDRCTTYWAEQETCDLLETVRIVQEVLHSRKPQSCYIKG